MKKFARIAIAGAVLAGLPFATLANTAPADSHSGHHSSAAQTAAELSEGEVRKVDQGGKKITIRHGELKNLDMPPMTMVFRVAEPTFLEQVKAGDKVNFVAEKVGGQFTVTRIEVRQ